MKRIALFITAAIALQIAYGADLCPAQGADRDKPATPAPATPRPQIRLRPWPMCPTGNTPNRSSTSIRLTRTSRPRLVFIIHWGLDGWQAKKPVEVAAFLKEGISVVSIEYRLYSRGNERRGAAGRGPLAMPRAPSIRPQQGAGVEHRQDAHRSDRRFPRAPARACGWPSIGYGRPKKQRPLAHESTRLTCAAVGGAQTTLDPQQMKEWTPNSNYGGHAFGFAGDREKNLSQFGASLPGANRSFPGSRNIRPTRWSPRTIRRFT